METVIKKWGNSLGIRIPSLIAKDLSLKEGSSVEIEDDRGRIVIKPKKQNDLKEMLEHIDNQNIHGEFETEGPAGNEAW
ncbi:MAG: AbrB/MazE/SpoVT family DNA-binding domain-containing protein [Spirochaetia bacterium]|nr:AbrB/MazE/SpoVT family DNA-binding domain-containing protein [Spirochaetia bacterium]MCF7953069.1 AbrB/MazE/SpoVT family DNA-binding domain-containing protein [Spirochaetales bacterium]